MSFDFSDFSNLEGGSEAFAAMQTGLMVGVDTAAKGSPYYSEEAVADVLAEIVSQFLLFSTSTGRPEQAAVGTLPGEPHEAADDGDDWSLDALKQASGGEGNANEETGEWSLETMNQVGEDAFAETARAAATLGIMSWKSYEVARQLLENGHASALEYSGRTLITFLRATNAIRRLNKGR